MSVIHLMGEMLCTVGYRSLKVRGEVWAEGLIYES
jgi:hypothetical protein